jgi:hypothetical protein
MKTRKKIICLENLPYKSHITVGSHHYAWLFSKDYDVLWISMPWYLLQLLKDRKSDRFKNWNFNRPAKIGNGFYSITPFIFLPYRNNFMLKNVWYLKNLYRFMPGLLSNIKKLGFENPDILWFTDPRHISILNYIKPDKIFYRCVDDLEHFKDIPIGLLEYERHLIKISDSVFLTSLHLMEKFDGLNKNSYYLPNGCDFDRFFKMESNKQYFEKIDGYFKKDKINILYTGAIAEWFDFDVLERVSKDEMFNFIIVGPVRVRISDIFKKRSNIVFTGPYPYEYMPYFAKRSNIGIIPFKINEITDSVNPIKLYEYSAAGLPTVVSGFKTILELNCPCFIYDSINEVDDAIENAIKASSDEKYKEKIIKFARDNSWEARYKFIKRLIG